MTAGIVLGLGLGGFVDGILLHQILQWHHLLSAHPDPAVANDASLNVLADGLFHAATWLLTVVGVGLLVRAFRMRDVPASYRILGGAGLTGWGIFNVVEGVVNHHLLAIHHVHTSQALAWDLAFLAFGAMLVVGGWLVARSDAAYPRDARGPHGSARRAP